MKVAECGVLATIPANWGCFAEEHGSGLVGLPMSRSSIDHSNPQHALNTCGGSRVRTK